MPRCSTIRNDPSHHVSHDAANSGGISFPDILPSFLSVLPNHLTIIYLLPPHVFLEPRGVYRAQSLEHFSMSHRFRSRTDFGILSIISFIHPPLILLIVDEIVTPFPYNGTISMEKKPQRRQFGSTMEMRQRESILGHVNVKIECAGPDYGKVGATLHEPNNSHCVAP